MDLNRAVIDQKGLVLNLQNDEFIDKLDQTLKEEEKEEKKGNNNPND
jgi:hypothetical protein